MLLIFSDAKLQCPAVLVFTVFDAEHIHYITKKIHNDQLTIAISLDLVRLHGVPCWRSMSGNSRRIYTCQLYVVALASHYVSRRLSEFRVTASASSTSYLSVGVEPYGEIFS